MTFPAKTPGEIKLVTFDFVNEAAPASTLSNAVVTVTKVVRGAGNVADITVGTMFVLGTKVSVLLGGGLDGREYRINCEVDASNGEHHAIAKDLPIAEKAALVK